jgi:hypothetical protein
VARVTNPGGSGNRDLGVIRDGDKPPIGSQDSLRQYDTYTGGPGVPAEWIGYAYTTAQLFTRVVFQEGKNFYDGGWFETLGVEVRRNGVWTPVQGLSSTPPYPANDGISYESYALDFTAVSGDGIRIVGAAGGSAAFVSVGELEVFGGIVAGAPAPATPTPAPATPTPAPTATASGVNLTALGTIVARVTAPLGGGSRDLEVIRDGDRPPVGTWAPWRQYDTFDGADLASEDWIGYSYASAHTFRHVIFQEGMQFWDGGWFDSLTVEVRQGGTWVTVSGLTATPAYPGANGVGYETFTLDFAPIAGDGIRLDGVPGGAADFISVGELEVFGD